MPAAVSGRKRKRPPRDGGSPTAAPSDAELSTMDSPGNTFWESKSVRERARPYLLAVAKMHLDVLDTKWSIGKNRGIDEGHVHALKETFNKGGLERHAEEHRIILLCDPKEVRRMKESLTDGEKGELSFLRWSTVNGSVVEVMAGQHRIHALRDFVRETNAPREELWWTCEFYSKGAMYHCMARPGWTDADSRQTVSRASSTSSCD